MKCLRQRQMQLLLDSCALRRTLLPSLIVVEEHPDRKEPSVEALDLTTTTPKQWLDTTFFSLQRTLHSGRRVAKGICGLNGLASEIVPSSDMAVEKLALPQVTKLIQHSLQHICTQAKDGTQHSAFQPL
eukprot:5845582-Amphidinium_carterae.1